MRFLLRAAAVLALCAPTLAQETRTAPLDPAKR